MATSSSEFTPEQYIEARVKQYQGWYDRKAVSCKNRHLRMRAFTVVAGGIVPVLVNVENSINSLLGYPVMKAAITVISLMVVVTVSLETVFHYREQWKNYRSTEQLLGHEQLSFLQRWECTRIQRLKLHSNYLWNALKMLSLQKTPQL